MPVKLGIHDIFNIKLNGSTFIKISYIFWLLIGGIHA
jgi:hypothetical protein